MSDLIGTSEKIPDTGLQCPEIAFSTGQGFQLCPKCSGKGRLGYSHEIYRVNTSSICPVCAGKMIINRQTGKPPE